MIRRAARWAAAALAALAAGAMLVTCSLPVPRVEPPQPVVSLDALGDLIPSDGARTVAIEAPLGLRLLLDAPRGPELALTRSILQANHRVEPVRALALALETRSVARARNLPVDFLAALVLQESAFSPHALSAAGAIGLGQLTIGTATWLGVDHPFDPRANLAGAADYLSMLLRRYRRHDDPVVLAAAAYNAGPGAVDAYHGIPPYPETQAYVRLVLYRWGRLVSDAQGAGGAQRR
ncbi:MAG TPA: lytic transglycosylase domain-containing protein [Candidatus Dormibacteraeota bacterium]|nr:lytic transglycosylase domain-containing protein [Candidatus Dormibacteraeota bacterium]